MTIEQIHDKHSMERVLRDAREKTVVFAFISYRCGHCKRLLPFLESLCQEMPDVIFKKVDVNASKDLMNEFGINGVPDTYLYKNGILGVMALLQLNTDELNGYNTNHHCNRVIGANNDLLLNNLMELRKKN